MKQEKYTQIKDYLRDLIKGTEWEGHVFAVGGCVRDEIMGQEIKDIDLCVSLPGGGVRFAEWLRDNNHALKQVTIYLSYGTAMLHLKAFPVFFVQRVEISQFVGHTGSGAYNRHISFQYVKELWELIDTGLPQKCAHLGHTRVIIVREQSCSLLLGIHYHGAEFQHLEYLPVFGSPALLEENRAFAVKFNGNGHNKPNRCQHNNCYQAAHKVKASFYKEVYSVHNP